MNRIIKHFYLDGGIYSIYYFKNNECINIKYFDKKLEEALKKYPSKALMKIDFDCNEEWIKIFTIRNEWENFLKIKGNLVIQ